MADRNYATLVFFYEFIKRVNAESNGLVRIDYLGGPEVVAAFDQPEAVRAGTVDVAFLWTGYYLTTLPEANVIVYSKLKPPQERQAGLYDFLDQLHRQYMNMVFLGRTVSSHAYNLFDKVRITKPADIKGQSFRGLAVYAPVLNLLGVTVVSMPISDVYTGLERGLIQGTVADVSDADAMKWYEQTKYAIDPPFWENNAVLTVNLNSWNKLPKSVQDLMIKTQIDIEKGMSDYFLKDVQTIRKSLQSKGMEFVQWSPDDSKWFLDGAYRAGWQALKDGTKARPDNFQRLYNMLGEGILGQ